MAVEHIATVPGLTDSARDQQSVFRQVMWALACPGEVREIAAAVPPPPTPLTAGAAAIAVTLADFETPVWLDAGLAASPDVADYLRFHTGAPIVTDPRRASFALVASGLTLPPFEDFAQGTLEYPDRSATLIVQVETLEPGGGLRLKGPGIAGRRLLSIKPLPEGFANRAAANRALFPRGIDLVFVAGNRVAALPRTTKVKG
jgi:alpha-D-ribose 1-methylphosphonate 5-triphosphate synthase subunit PhnH